MELCLLGLPLFGPGSHTSITKTWEHFDERTISRKNRVDQKRNVLMGFLCIYCAHELIKLVNNSA
jgi:hypothetical protein